MSGSLKAVPELGLLTLRMATMDDAKMVFSWRNMPEIIAMGTTRRPVQWDEHLSWFQKVVRGDQHLFFIVLLGQQAIGQVRLDRVDERSCEVSIYLLPEFTGRGLGVLALKHACWESFATMKVKELLAHIREDNQRSVTAFQRAGFKLVPQSDKTPSGHHLLRIERPGDVSHNRLTFDEREVKAVAETVQSGQWTSGPKVVELETELAKLGGVSYAVCVSSGTSALRLALKGLGANPGDGVLIPAYSCVALANATLACGAAPLPVDVDSESFNIDHGLAAKMLEDAGRSGRVARLAAIIAVNTFGAPALTESLMSHGVPVIEDCAHGFGIRVGGEPLGGRAEAGVLSFYATKLIGAGEGGAVLTNKAELASFVKGWRDYGDQAPDRTRLNDKMTDIEAALALCQLRRLPEMIHTRQQLVNRYDELLSAEAKRMGLFRLPSVSHTRVWYRYAVEMIGIPARDVVEKLRPYGIIAAQPVTDWRPLNGPSCPVADEAYRHLISLPLYPTLTAEEQSRVCHAFLSVCKGFGS
jgi:perosamine synthetase